MVTFEELFDKVIRYEGYYANVEGDRGGETYMGIARNLHPDWKGWETIDDFKQEFGAIKHNGKIPDSKLTELVKDFYREHFYEKYHIGSIRDGSLQEIIFDWCVNSGYYSSRGVQQVLNQSFNYNLKLDGIIGTRTINAINNCTPLALFKAIKLARIKYYHAIARKGQNYKFLKGWLKRINSITFETK